MFLFTSLKFVEHYVPQDIKNVVLGACVRVLEVSGPVSQFCKDLNEIGLGVFERMMPHQVKDLFFDGCHLWLDNSVEIENFCHRMQDIGLTAFKQIGSFEAKEMTLETCSTFNNARLLVLIPLVLTGGTAAYFTYRFFQPNR